jgi:hypothetical protein
MLRSCSLKMKDPIGSLRAPQIDPTGRWSSPGADNTPAKVGGEVSGVEPTQRTSERQQGDMV